MLKFFLLLLILLACAPRVEAVESLERKIAMTQQLSYKTAYDLQKDKLLSFPDFGFTYLGEEASPQDPKAPTVSFKIRNFVVTDKQGHTHKLKISFGQVAPAPLPFVVEDKHFVLLTYALPNDERLFPNRFALLAK